MDVEELQKLHSLAKEIGLEGKDLQDFLREERATFRERKNEEREERERELERQEKQREYDRQERDFERREREIERQEREREIERQERERERERQHELELAKIKAETSFVSQTSTTGITNNQGVQSQVKTAKLPLFDEKVDSIDAYLSRFEKYHEAVKSQKENWAIYLAALLKGKALEVYSRLSSEDANNYDVLKTALLRRYQLTEDSLKKKFYSSSPESGESATQFMIRLANELDRWIDATKIPQTLNGLKNLLIKEQFLTACDLKMAMYLREKEVADNTELAKTAERYMDAHCMLTMKPVKSQPLEVKKRQKLDSKTQVPERKAR